MGRERAIWLIIAFLLLVVGVVIGRWATGTRPETSISGPGGGSEFRQWFWERRTLDLMIQVGLILAGALGVAAILPGEDEGDGAASHLREGGRS